MDIGCKFSFIGLSELAWRGNGPVDNVNTGENFAAINWQEGAGYWEDLNESYKFPYIIEFDNLNEPAPLNVAINGYKKVLVIPARFQDEGNNYNGGSAPITDQFGQVLFPELQEDSFDVVSQPDLQDAMQQVKTLSSATQIKVFIWNR